MWWLGFNLSVAVVVGFIALAGVAAETGVVMLIYLDHALTELKATARAEGRAIHARRPLHGDHVRRGRARSSEDDDRGGHHGRAAADHVEHGTGAEVMQRIAVPMIGGMVSSTLLTLIVIPAIYAVVKGVNLRRLRLNQCGRESAQGGRREPADDERLQLLSMPRTSFSGGPAGAICSKVHCRGALSGRKRTSLVPCRKRLPVTWSKATSTTSSGLTGSQVPSVRCSSGSCRPALCR